MVAFDSWVLGCRALEGRVAGVEPSIGVVGFGIGIELFIAGKGDVENVYDTAFGKMVAIV